jgi:hypothetical protein
MSKIGGKSVRETRSLIKKSVKKRKWRPNDIQAAKGDGYKRVQKRLDEAIELLVDCVR